MRSCYHKKVTANQGCWGARISCKGAAVTRIKPPIVLRTTDDLLFFSFFRSCWLHVSLSLLHECYCHHYVSSHPVMMRCANLIYVNGKSGKSLSIRKGNTCVRLGQLND